MRFLITASCPHVALVHFVVGILFCPRAKFFSKFSKLIWRRHKQTKWQKKCAYAIADKSTPAERDIKVPRQFRKTNESVNFHDLAGLRTNNYHLIFYVFAYSLEGMFKILLRSFEGEYVINNP